MNLLIAENPMVVSPTLACRVGVEEAIFLQQIHFLNQHSRNERDGHKWVYNTYDEWVFVFPFLKNADKVKRIVSKLEKLGVLITTNKYNRLKIDNRKWYRVNYESKLLIIGEKAKMPDEGAKMPDEGAKMPDEGAKMPDEGAKMPDQYTKTYNKEINTPLPPNAPEQKNQNCANAPVSANTETSLSESQFSEPENNKPVAGGKKKKNTNNAPVAEIMNLYNKVLGGVMPRAVALTDYRKKEISARWKELLGTLNPRGEIRYAGVEDGLNYWERLFAKALKNDHWCGENDRDWRADLDWFMKPKNFIKLLEFIPRDKK